MFRSYLALGSYPSLWPASRTLQLLRYHPWFFHEISLLDPVPSKEEHYRTLFLSNPSVKKEEALSSLLPTLPEPRSLRSMMEELRSNLLAHPTAMLGEVGIDRSFRIAEPPYPSPAPRKLTPFVTPITHQLEILEAQLDLAVELKRNVSMHSVASQQATMDLLKKMEKKHDAAWRMISIDMHSCGFSLESWKDIEVCGIALLIIPISE